MRLLLSLLVVAVAASGCRRVSTRTLKDTEGRTFTAECDRQGQCNLTRDKAEPGSPDKKDLVLHSPGRLVAMCDAAGDAKPDLAADCRPLVCESDDACPPAHGLKHGTCVNGLCTEPANPLTQDDSVLLCLAGTGMGKSAAAQVDRYAMGLNCGSPCVVPKPCRQP